MVLENIFLNPIGLYALAGLIPLIIVYLIKPKPHQEMIPSLMFLMRKHGKSMTSSFLQRLVHNILLYLQIFVIILIALSIAQPFIMVAEGNLAKHSVIILDTSASMKAGNRFQEAKDYAFSQLGDLNSIILLKDVPEVVLREGSQADARLILNNLQPYDTTTNMFDAVKAVESVITDTAKVTIISDFIDTSSPASYETSIRSLRSKGNVVNLKSVFSKQSNVAIIDLEVGMPKSSVTVKNYDSEERHVRLLVRDVAKDFTLSGFDVRTLDFDTPLGTNEIKIETDDDFKADNVAYIATPKTGTLRALLITNNPNEYLRAALEENDEIILQIANPPSIFSYDFDVVIIGDADPDKILAGTILGVKDNIERGNAGIITANNRIKSIGYDTLLTLGDKQKDKVVSSHPATQDTDFGSNYFIPDSKGLPLAKANESYVITYQEIGNGKMMYYGIIDSESGFKLRPKYPVFWKDMINFLLNRKPLNEINIKTGKLLTFENPVYVKTPLEELQTDKIALDNSGFYDFGNYIIASNLIDFKESDVNVEVPVEEVFGDVTGSRGELPLVLSFFLLLVLICLLFIEVIYVKYRGDI